MTANAAPADRPNAREAVAGLSARDLKVLEFERDWSQHVGAKEEAIRDVFGLSAARYYQLLNVVIDSPDAVRQDPMLVGRLQRARDSRLKSRAARTFSRSSASDTVRHPRSTETIE